MRPCGNQKWVDNGLLNKRKVMTLSRLEKLLSDGMLAEGAFMGQLMALTLQARTFGLYTHGMAGIKRKEIPDALNIPEAYEVMAGFAIGALDTPDNLDKDFQENEMPSGRKPLREIWRRREY